MSPIDLVTRIDPRPWIIGGVARVVLKGEIWPFRQIRRYINEVAPDVGKGMDAIADAPDKIVDWLKKKTGH